MKRLNLFLSSVLFFLSVFSGGVSAAPGGVDGGNLQTWLKADADVYENAGTDPVEDGDTVWQWNDQTGNLNHSEQSIAADRPAYIEDGFNFNPTLSFDGTSDWMDGPYGGGYTQQFYVVISPDQDINNTTPDQTVFTTDAVNTKTSDVTFYSFGASTAALSNEVFTFGSGTSADYRRAFVSTTESFSREEPYILNVSNNNATTTTQIHINGTQRDNATAGTYNNAESDEEYRIAGNDFVFGGAFSDAKYSEVVIYSVVSTATERAKIETYLSIKYGITKSGDYLDSSGNTIWNSTVNATYHNDIGGIGRDDASDLSQVKTKSENNDAVVTMDKGGSFSSDQDFVLWGNDNGALTTTSTGAHPSYGRRSTRIWKAAVSGTPGNVTVSLDLSQIPQFGSRNAADYALLIDGSDADFSSGATAHTTGVSFVGDVLTFTNVSLSDGDFFAIGGPQPPYPGGISNGLTLWFRADAETYEDTLGVNPAEDGDALIVWGDQAAGNDASQSTSAERPIFQNDTGNNINFNPVVDFDGVNDFLPIANLFYNVSTNPIGDFTVFSTVRNSGSNERIVLSFDESSFFKIAVGSGSGGEIQLDTRSGSTNQMDGLTDVSDSIPHIIGGNYDQTASEKNIYLDGAVDNNISAHSGGNLGNPAEVPRYGFIGIGSEATTFDGTTGPNNEFSGEMGELILYADTLTAGERNRVESYMAFKYGITLNQSGAGQDYTASDGTTIMWDTSDNRGISGVDYIYDIAGIGQDDGSALEQLQSKSVNADAIVEMSKSGGFSADNTFLVWANDNGALTITSSGAHPSYAARLTRVWRVDSQGSPGSVSVSFDLSKTNVPNTGNGVDYALLIDASDADFSSGATAHTTGASVSGDILTFTGVNFSDGNFFTLASPPIAAPGGVLTALTLWFRADQGVTGTTSVTEWEDQSGNDYHCSQPGSGNEPSLLDDDINFNASLTFNGTSDYCAIETLNYAAAGTLSQVAVFTVFRTGYTGGTANGNTGFLAFDDNQYFDFIIRGDNGGLRTRYRTNVSAAENRNGATTGLNNDEPQIGAFIFDGNQANDTIIRLNGSVDLSVNAEPAGADIGFNATTRYGFIGEGSEATTYNGTRDNVYYDGEIAEVIYYPNQALTSTEIDRIESYLALKYGVTKAGNYLDSDGDVIWNATTNSSYHFDVVGIGKDVGSNLEQTQSRSENNDGVIRMEKTGGFTTDESFVIWGNNNQSGTAWTGTGAPTNFQRLAREWRVAVTGTPGTVLFEVNVDDGDMNIPALTVANYYYLLLDTDNDNSLTDEDPIRMTDYGGGLWQVSVDFVDGQEFSIAQSLLNEGPGGVSTNLQAWFKADDGVYEDSGGTDPAEDDEIVLRWNDFGATNSDATAFGTSGTRPSFETGEFNFNPVVRFRDDGNRHLETTSNPASGSMSLIAVFRTEQTDDGGDFSSSPALIGGEVTAVNNDYALGLAAGRPHIKSYTGTGYGTRGPSSFADDIPHIMTGTRVQAASGAVEIYMDGTSQNTGTSDNTALSAPTGIGLGNHVNETAGGQFEGDMAEAIVYNAVLNAADRNKVESYLAVKYGITLAGDYVKSDGSVIWDSSTNSVYHNDVAGIGADDIATLDQPMSRSVNADSIVIVSNASDLDDEEYFLWGNDNDDDGTIEWTLSNMPSGIDQRLDRTWRVAETGDVGTVDLLFDLSDFSAELSGMQAEEFRLLIDNADADMSSGAVYVIKGSSYTSDTLTFDDVPAAQLNDGDYFTLGVLRLKRRVIVVE